MLPITTSIAASLQDIKCVVTAGHPTHYVQLLLVVSTTSTGYVSFLQLPLPS